MSLLKLKAQEIFALTTTELNESSRLRRMIWVVCYIALLYVVSFLYDVNQLSAEKKQRFGQQLARVESTDNIDTWNQRLSHEQDVLSELQSSCWNAGTPELASADMQTILRQLTTVYGLKNPRFNLAQAEGYSHAGRAGWLIRAQVTARAESGVVPPLVNALEASDSFFVIERMQFVERRGGSLDLLLSACFLEPS